MGDVYRRALERVIQICGGIDAAATRLEVDARVLQRWQRGLGQPTADVFLRCVDVILNESLPELREISKRRGPPPPR